MSHLIADELSKLKVKFNKKNETRWNSILFMIDSVHKVTPNQFKVIQDKMPENTLLRLLKKYLGHQRQSRECSLFLDTFSALKEED